MKPNTPHDAFFKLIFSQPEHASGELQSVLPAELVRRIAWSTLELCPGSFVAPELARSHTDLLFSARIDGRPTLLYFLFEHLSTSPPLMPFRLLSYQVDIWKSWLSKHPRARKLPAILSIVLHHSETGWRGATRFEDILDVSARTAGLIGPFVPRFELVLDDVSKEQDAALRDRAMTALGTIALWCFRDVRKRGVLLRDVLRWGDLFEEVLKAPNGVDAVRAVFKYIAAASGEAPSQEDVERIVQTLGARDEEAMRTLGEQMSEVFMERGIARGQRGILLRMLRKRFGELPEDAVARVNAADPATLEGWADRLLVAKTLAEVWGES
jgi:hypothetical protein